MYEELNRIALNWTMQSLTKVNIIKSSYVDKRERAEHD